MILVVNKLKLGQKLEKKTEVNHIKDIMKKKKKEVKLA